MLGRKLSALSLAAALEQVGRIFEAYWEAVQIGCFWGVVKFEELPKLSVEDVMEIHQIVCVGLRALEQAEAVGHAKVFESLSRGLRR